MATPLAHHPIASAFAADEAPTRKIIKRVAKPPAKRPPLSRAALNLLAPDPSCPLPWVVTPKAAAKKKKIVSRRKERPRWGLRLVLLSIIIGGELVLADESGELRLPHDLGAARAMFVP